MNDQEQSKKTRSVNSSTMSVLNIHLSLINNKKPASTRMIAAKEIIKMSNMFTAA